MTSINKITTTVCTTSNSWANKITYGACDFSFYLVDKKKEKSEIYEKLKIII